MVNKYGGEDRRRASLLHSGVSVADIVSIGTSIITAVGIGGPLLVWGGKMDQRVAHIENKAIELSLEDKRYEQKSDVMRAEFREEVREINRKLDVLIEKSGRNGK